MESNITISVIMATYNGERFLQTQLESIASQILLPAELIISDDGSTDNTMSIIEKFASRAPFPVSIKSNINRLGYSDNFFSAANFASSEYIAFCDQDDIWANDKLFICARAISESKPLLCVHMASMIDVNSNRIGVLLNGTNKPGSYSPLEQSPWVVHYGFTMVFHRLLLTIIDPTLRGGSFWGETLPLPHDSWIYILANSLGKITVIPDELAQYRQHENNASSSSPKSLLSKFSYRIGPTASRALCRSASAALYARLIGDISASKWDPKIVRAAADHWRKISLIESMREDMYVDPRLISRFRRLGQIAASGGYRSFEKSGLNYWISIKDFFVGVMRIRRIKG